MEVAIVVHRAGDTLGFVEVETGELVDAVWVGDEPSNLRLSADGSVAWVSLATEAAAIEVATPTASGAALAVGYGDDLVYATAAIIAGSSCASRRA